MVYKDFFPLATVNNYWRFLNISPLRFNMIDIQTCNPACDDPTQCDDFWDYHTYHYNRVSFHNLTQCVCESELQIEAILGTSLFEKQFTDILEVPRNFSTFQKPGVPITQTIFKTKERHVIDYGKYETEIIQDDIPLGYADLDSDGFHEIATFTVTLPTDVEPCEIEVYIANTDFRITPVTFKFNETTRLLTGTIDGWLLAKPELYINHDFLRKQKAINGCDLNNFVDDVDIKRKFINSCKPQAWLVYEQHNCNNKCEQKEIPCCVKPIYNCEGTFQIIPGSINTTTGCFEENFCGCFCGCPVRLKVCYTAGLCKRCADGCEHGNCNCLEYENLVFNNATACLPEQCLCAACILGNLVSKQTDVNIFKQKEGIRFLHSSSDRNNPLGSSIAQIDAWKAIMRIWDDSSTCVDNLL